LIDLGPPVLPGKEEKRAPQEKRSAWEDQLRVDPAEPSGRGALEQRRRGGKRWLLIAAVLALLAAGAAVIYVLTVAE
jgi:hypothetical protein